MVASWHLIWLIRELVTEEDLDLVGEAMVYGYFYDSLSLKGTGDRDYLALNGKTRTIVKHLIDLIGKMCRNGRLNMEE